MRSACGRPRSKTVRALGARVLLIVAVLLQQVPAASANSLPMQSEPRVAASIDMPGAVRALLGTIVTALGLNAVSDTTAAATHDVSLSTSWSAFVAGVNVVGGNLSLQSKDLSVPSVGFGSAVVRTYNSAASNRTGVFGVGWYWSYGVRIERSSGLPQVVREDGRTDSYAGNGPRFTPPAGVYDDLEQNGDGTYTLRRHDQVEYRFGAGGLLDQITDPNGNVLRVERNGGTVSTLVDTAGRLWRIDSDSTGRIVGVTDPAGRRVSYVYDSAGDLVEVIDPAGGHVRYAYDLSHYLTQVTDQAGHSTSYAYDGQGRVTTMTDAAGNTSAVTYSVPSRQTTFTDALQHTRSFSFDPNNRVVGVTDGTGKTENTVWDSGNNRESVTDRNGHSTHYSYDTRGNVTSVVDAANGQTQATYDSGNRPITAVDALGRTTSYAYDAGGNLARVVAPSVGGSSSTTSYTHDARGQRITATDANNHTTTYSYDAVGNQITVTDALGHAITRTFDAAGRVLSETDPDGRTSSNTYDVLGRVLTSTDGSGATTTSTYDAVGNRLTSVDALGHTTTFTYDVRNLLVKATNALGQSVQTGYDRVGNKTTVTDALNHVTLLAYDTNNRVVGITDANGLTTSYTYDSVGSQRTVTDPAGRTTTFDYDALNRLTRVTDPLGGRAVYGYDAVGHRISTTDPNDHTSTNSFDALDRLASQTDADNASLAFAYDGVGNLLKKTDGNGLVTTYGYDAANRLLEARYPEGTITYAYDGAGNRVRMTDPILGTTTYSYDSARRLTSTNASTGTTSYVYDRAGNLTSIGYPNGGGSVSYGYDALNRAVLVTDPNGLVSGFSYDAAGRKATASQPNGTRGTFTYDAGGRVTGIQWSGPNGGAVLGLRYTYDAAGNTTQVVDAAGANTYQYDRLDRLVDAQYSDGSSEHFQYDPAGNRTSLTSRAAGGGAASTAFYSYNAANRLQSVGNNSVSWDGNGNQLSKGATTYRYDSQNRLLQAGTPAQVIQMAYDGANHRVTYSVAGAATNYTYDEHSSLARVLTESNAQHAQLYGVNGDVLWDRSSEQGLLYFHQDAVGSTAVLTKPDGSVAGSRNYKAFGEPRGQTGALAGSFWFAGEQLDPETGLIYLRARYYDPSLGRFLQADPAEPDVRDTQGLNAYVYAKNNPLRYTDPTGLWSWDDTATALKVVGVAAAVTGIVACTVLTAGLCGAALAVGTAITVAQTGVDVVRYVQADSPEKKQEIAWDLVGDAFSLAVNTSTLKAVGGLRNGAGTKLLDFRTTAARGLLRDFAAVDGLGAVGDTVDLVAPALWPKGGNTGCSCSGPTNGHTQPRTTSIPRDVQQPSVPGAYGPGVVGYTNTSQGRVALRVSGGALVPVGRPPHKPGNVGPRMWDVRVGSNMGFDWHDSGSPDGRPIVATKVFVYNQGGEAPLYESPWVSGTHLDVSGLPYWILDWNVQVMDDRQLVSDKSDRWSFSLSDPRVTIIHDSVSAFAEQDNAIPASAQEMVGIKACTDGNAHMGVSLSVKVNEDNHGTTAGPWRIVNQLGVWCYDTNPGTPDHPHWHTLPFADGPHVIRIEALHSGVDYNDPNVFWDTYDFTYTLPHRRPASPELVAPLDATATSNRTVQFQWKPTTNATSYRVRAGMNPDPAVAPVLDVTVDGNSLSYTASLSQDYSALYWHVVAINDLGSNASGTYRLAVDRIAPTASVRQLSDVSAQDAFLVRWAANDDNSGVKCTNIQVSDGQDGVWADWFGCTNLDFSLYQGQDGHTYYFRARARDKAENLGAFASDVGDTHIRVNVAAANEWWNGAYSRSRPISVLNNFGGELPAGYVVRLRLDGTTSPTALQVYDASSSPRKCDDVRVVHQNAADLDRIVLSCTSSAIDILFRLVSPVAAASLDASTYRLYYGNPAASNPPMQRNAVLYPTIDAATLRAYDMLEGTGMTTADASAHSAGALDAGLGWSTAGKFGPAIVFPSDRSPNPALQAGSGGLPNSAFTIEFWMKRNADDGGTIADQIGAGFHPRWGLFLFENRLRLDVWPRPGAGSQEVRSARVLNDASFYSNYHHFAVTFDGGNVVRFYVDGRLDVGRTLADTGLVASGSPLRIGDSGINASISGFTLSEGVRTDFAYGQLADVTTDPTVVAGAEQVLTTPLPTPTPTATPTATPTVAANVVDGGSGNDGPLSVSGWMLLANHPTPASGAAGSTTLAVGSNNAYTPGDEIFIHQTRGDGHYEFARVQSVSGAGLTLRGPLAATYQQGAQVVRVPNLTDLTIPSGATLSTAPWNGSAGGLLVLRASGRVQVQSGGRIDVTGVGFNGGLGRPYPCDSGDSAQQGESASGTGVYLETNNGSGGGGGRRTNTDGGGGGGGHATAGGSGQWGSAGGGAPSGPANLSALFFGGGGGGSACTGSAATGGAGGGAVWLVAPSIGIDGGGAILASGAAGSTGPAGGGGSGGGAGGAIYLRAGVLQLGTQQVRAEGGPGGAGTNNYGGSGGFGRIHLESVQRSGSTYPAADVGTLPGGGTPTVVPSATPSMTPTFEVPNWTLVRCSPGYDLSSCYATGEYGDSGNDAAWRGADGDLGTQWSSLGGSGEFWQATFFRPVPLAQATIWGRGGGDSIAGKLVFSDGSEVPFGQLNGSGCAHTVSFATRTVTFVRYQITGTSSRGNAGFRELEAYAMVKFSDGDDCSRSPSVVPTPTPTSLSTPATATPTRTPTPVGTPLPAPMAAPAFGSGQDGDVVITTPVDLNPVGASASGVAGANQLGIANMRGSGFTAGQLLLIHQTRGAAAGTWELNYADAVSATALSLRTPLRNTYVTDSGGSRAQVVWVPQYHDFTITGSGRVVARPWDGYSGGIVVFLANGTASIGGVIDAAGARGWHESPGAGGFRGGNPKPHGPDHDSGGAEAGEGTPGDALRQTAANGNGGGGGFTYGQYGGSGGGGSHATTGSNGSLDNTAIAGQGSLAIVDDAALQSMSFGGGGGGAAIDGAGPVGAGGAGGGIVLIAARTLSVVAPVTADGGHGDSENYGGGGAGAGGSVLIRAEGGQLGDGLVTARGGIGGNKPATNPGWDGGTWLTRPGGDGGNGRVRVEACRSMPGSTLPQASTATSTDLCPAVATATPTPTPTETATPTQTPTNVPTSDRMYEDFSSGATNWSMLGNAALIGSGTTAYLRFTPQAESAAEASRNTIGERLSAYRAISVRVNLNGGTLLDGDASALFLNQNGWKYVSLSNYVVQGSSAWQTATVPLVDFAGFDPTQSFDSIGMRFWVPVNSTIDVDDIRFLSGLPTATPTSTSTSTSTSTATSTSTPTSTTTPTARRIHGDLNRDGHLDMADYNVLLGEFGQVGPNLRSDLNGDQRVDIFDYSILLEILGAFGMGTDGPLTVTGPATVVNKYTSASGAAGSTLVTVESTSGFAIGDEVLVHQTRGAGAGTYEFRVISSMSGNLVTLNSALQHAYSGSAQMIRVPHFTDVTVAAGGSLTSAGWDGTKGGILVFRSNGQVVVNGTIDASERGFRGGLRGTGTSDAPGFQGEGTGGVGSQSPVANGTGGGGGSTGNAGTGAGGGHATPGHVGLNGSPAASPGAAFGDPRLNLLVFGGAGGAGSYDFGPGQGGNSGGIVYIASPLLDVSGRILARGGSGTKVSAGGSGGAGSGGAIFVQVYDASIGTARVDAAAVVNPENQAGSAGRIHVESCIGTGTSTPEADRSAPAWCPGSSTPTPTPIPTATATIVPTVTPSPTATATATATVDASLPDLLVDRLAVELETSSACSYSSTTLGVRVWIRNAGVSSAAPFTVDVDGVRQRADGLAAGASTALWFSSYGHGSGATTLVTVDALSEVAETREDNNARSEVLPVPTLPPSCTPTSTLTPTPTATPTLTPTQAPTATPVRVVRWTRNASGNWDDATAWSTGQLPQPGQDVVIDVAGAITVTIRTGSTISINTVHSAESLVIAGGSLSIDSASDIQGTLTQSSGTLTGDGDLSVAGVVTWSGGTMSGLGRTIAAGGLSITGSAIKTLSGRHLENRAAGIWTGTGNIASGNGARLTNGTDATLTIQNDRTLQFSLGGTIPTLSNAGLLVKNASTATTTLQALLDNAGTVDVQSGTLVLEGGTSSGTFQVQPAATLRFARISTQPATGTHNLDVGSRMVGAGTVDFAGGTATSNGTLAVTGTTSVTGGVLNQNSDATIGALTISSGALGGSATLNVTGPLTWTGGAMQDTGRTTALGPLTIDGAAAKSLNGRALDNAGLATWSGSGNISTTNGAAITNLAGASFSIQNDQNLTVVTGGTIPTFANAGALIKTGSAGTTSIATAFTNTGSVEVASGTLKLTRGYTQTAGLTKLSGGGLAGTNNSTLFSLQGGLLTGTGVLTGSLSNAGRVEVGGAGMLGTLSITGTYTQLASGTLAVEVGGGATCSGFDRLAVTGKATLAGSFGVRLLSPCDPAAGQNFVIVSFASRTGDFSTVTGVAPQFTRSTGATGITLTGT